MDVAVFRAADDLLGLDGVPVCGGLAEAVGVRAVAARRGRAVVSEPCPPGVVAGCAARPPAF